MISLEMSCIRRIFSHANTSFASNVSYAQATCNPWSQPVDNSVDQLARLRTINEMAPFNRWCSIEVVAAGPGSATIAMPWREETGQYSNFLHAGLIGALIDTACGFAAVTLVARVMASHYSVNCLRPAVGRRFTARAKVVKPGKSQIFTACELFAENGAGEKLVATGETLLLVVNQDSNGS